MSDPIGYLLTWTCYGTWLHGDERGSVDADHNDPNAEFAPPDFSKLLFSVRKLKGTPVRLTDPQRAIAANTIQAHCDFRNWTLHAQNVRSNHAHAVISCNVHPRTAMDQIKAWCTRRLRDAGEYARDARVWTEGGSRRWLWTNESLRRAVVYVNDYQGD